MNCCSRVSAKESHTESDQQFTDGEKLWDSRLTGCDSHRLVGCVHGIFSKMIVTAIQLKTSQAALQGCHSSLGGYVTGLSLEEVFTGLSTVSSQQRGRGCR